MHLISSKYMAFSLLICCLSLTLSYAQYGTSDTNSGGPVILNTPVMNNPTGGTGSSAPPAPTVVPEAVYINSSPISDMQTDLVPGVAYVPASAFADAIGATLSQSQAGDLINFEYGPILASLDVYGDATRAATAMNALRVQGSSNPVPDFSPAGVLLEDTIYVPVEVLSQVFGAEASVSQVGSAPTLLVVSPRAELLSIRFFPAGRSGSARNTESFVLEFSAIAPVTETRNVALGVVTYRFEHSDGDQNEEYTGELMRRGKLMSGQGWLDLRLELTRGNDSQLLNEMREGRYIVSVDIADASRFSVTKPTPSSASAAAVPSMNANISAPASNARVSSSSVSSSNPLAPQNRYISRPSDSANSPDSALVTGLPNRSQVLLDPAHGGIDRGMDLGGVSEAEQTYRLAHNLQASLSSQGLSVGLTRSADSNVSLAERSSMAVGVPLFVSLHASNLPARTFNIYYLGESSRDSSLSLALQQNAESALRSNATDAIRRQVLLSLVPDLSRGEGYARQFTNYLAGEGLRFQTVDAAPLYVLSGAGGHGVLLELSRDDLGDAEGIAYLAEALDAAIVAIAQQN